MNWNRIHVETLLQLYLIRERWLGSEQTHTRCCYSLEHFTLSGGMCVCKQDPTNKGQILLTYIRGSRLSELAKLFQQSYQKFFRFPEHLSEIHNITE